VVVEGGRERERGGRERERGRRRLGGDGDDREMERAGDRVIFSDR